MGTWIVALLISFTSFAEVTNSGYGVQDSLLVRASLERCFFVAGELNKGVTIFDQNVRSDMQTLRRLLASGDCTFEKAQCDVKCAKRSGRKITALLSGVQHWMECTLTMESGGAIQTFAPVNSEAVADLTSVRDSGPELLQSLREAKICL